MKQNMKQWEFRLDLFDGNTNVTTQTGKTTIATDTLLNQ